MEDHIYKLFILSIPVACVAWTVTKESIFKEPRDFCIEKSIACKNLFQRKFFYLFTCEYCFSHYVTVLLLIITQYKMLYPDWRGYLISGFSIIWVANVYMSLYNLIRIDLKKEKIRTAIEESELNNRKPE